MKGKPIANSIGEWGGYEEIVYEDSDYTIISMINIKEPFIPYFRLYYKDKMCRISLLEPKYLGLEGEDLILDHNQKIRLIEILKSQTDGDDISNWEMIICLYNRFHSDYVVNISDDNYFELKENMILPNLIMPDYTKLPGGD